VFVDVGAGVSEGPINEKVLVDVNMCMLLVAVAIGAGVSVTTGETIVVQDINMTGMKMAMINFFIHLCFARNSPTACVTRAGAGGGTPSERKKDKA
jgi:hypothetical protein